MKTPNTYFQNKKTIVSFVLSIFVFYIHFHVFSVYKNAGGYLGFAFKQLLIVTKVAVPLFFVISGALFYRNYTLNLTGQKYINRFFSLCIPYLVWNTVWFVLALLGNYTPLGAVLGGVKASFSLENMLKGIFLYGYFEPFWFMFQLITLTAACPIIYLLLRNKKVGMVVILSFFAAICAGFKLSPKLFPNSNMVLFYLIGAWIGIHYFSSFTTRRSKPQALAGVVTYILCCVYHGTTDQLPECCTCFQISLVITTISCAAFWIAFDCFDIRRCPKYAEYSFLVYALHSFIGAAISKVLDMLMPEKEVYLLLTAAIAFPATIFIICVIGWLLDKYCPHWKRILTGR